MATKREWQQVDPVHVKQSLKTLDQSQYDWPEPVRYIDVRGEHRVLRILVEIEVREGDGQV